jgi:hypothetical protein
MANVQPTYPQDVTHYCRYKGCGYAANSRPGASAHAVLRAHMGTHHTSMFHRPVPKCNANCGLKATYEEKLAGTMLYGAKR